MIDLVLKYRLIWDINTLYIQNDYSTDYAGSITTLVTAGILNCYESNVYQNILDKITQEGLIPDPNNPQI